MNRIIKIFDQKVLYLLLCIFQDRNFHIWITNLIKKYKFCFIPFNLILRWVFVDYFFLWTHNKLFVSVWMTKKITEAARSILVNSHISYNSILSGSTRGTWFVENKEIWLFTNIDRAASVIFFLSSFKQKQTIYYLPGS